MLSTTHSDDDEVAQSDEGSSQELTSADWMSLFTQAFEMQAQSELDGDMDMLTEAVDLYRQALGLSTLSHPDRSYVLSNLANALTTLHDDLGDWDLLAAGDSGR
jgi:hypothetical protein